MISNWWPIFQTHLRLSSFCIRNQTKAFKHWKRYCSQLQPTVHKYLLFQEHGNKLVNLTSRQSVYDVSAKIQTKTYACTKSLYSVPVYILFETAIVNIPMEMLECEYYDTSLSMAMHIVLKERLWHAAYSPYRSVLENHTYLQLSLDAGSSGCNTILSWKWPPQSWWKWCWQPCSTSFIINAQQTLYALWTT